MRIICLRNYIKYISFISSDSDTISLDIKWCKYICKVFLYIEWFNTHYWKNESVILLVDVLISYDDDDEVVQEIVVHIF